MGRSGGGGGGGRSSGGFGGGRSSGGFSGGGRSSRGSFGSSSTYRSRPRTSTHVHYHRGPRYYGGPGYPRGPRRGFSILPYIMVIIIIAVIVGFSSSGGNTSSVPKSTKDREPLQGVVKKTDWYQDDLSWIISKNVMIDGLEDFYQETGIQPYIAFIPYMNDLWNGNDLNVTKADAYLETLYEERFQDEGHFIFAYFSSSFDSRSEMEGQFRYMSGYAVDSIMDSEAISILWGYFEKYYYDTSLTIEEMISTTFSKTADSIMDKATNGWDFAKIAVIVGGVVVVVTAVFMVIKTKAKREREKEEYTKEILDKPLETFGEDTSNLEEKYKNDI